MNRRLESWQKITLRSGGATHQGKVRANNQDAYAVTDGVFVLTDGMGGHSGGEVASEVAATTVVKLFSEPSRGRKAAERRSRSGLENAVTVANHEVIKRAATNPDLRGMGTTLCAIVAATSQDGAPILAVANVGDSRVYRLTAGALSQVSEDHSLVADLVRAGELSATEAARHPQRNVLTRALGIEVNLAVDTWELAPVAGDRFLLCSDGLFNELDHRTITDALLNFEEPQDAADALTGAAVAAGGHDNVTVLVVDVTEAPETAKAATSEAHTKIQSVVPALPKMRRKIVTWRVSVFFATLLVLAGVVFGSIWYYAQSGWFVGQHEGRVSVFQGRPDGLLWFEPRLAVSGGVSVAELSEHDQDLVAAAIEADSLMAAREVMERLNERSGG